MLKRGPWLSKPEPESTEPLRNATYNFGQRECTVYELEVYIFNSEVVLYFSVVAEMYILHHSAPIT